MCALLVAQVALAGLVVERPVSNRVVDLPSGAVAGIAVASCVMYAASIVLAFLVQRIAQFYSHQPASLSGWGELPSSAKRGRGRGRSSSSYGQDSPTSHLSTPSSYRHPMSGRATPSPRTPDMMHRFNGYYGPSSHV